MTPEENKAVADAETAAWFAKLKKVPSPEPVIDPKTKEHFASMLRQVPSHVANQKDDYERSLTRSLT